MISIYFDISSKLRPDDFVQYCAEQMNIKPSDFVVVENFIDYCSDNEINSDKFYIEHRVTSGQFDAWFEAYLKEEKFNDIKERVDFLKGLSSKYNLEILTSDEDLNPYSFILIKPDKTCCTIVVDYDSYDEKKEMNFGQYRNAFFGTIALENKIDENELKKSLSNIFSDYYDDLIFEYYNQDFFMKSLKEKTFLGKLFKNNYPHHYILKTEGKQNWYSVRQRVDIFKEGIKELAKKSDLEICLFPADYSKIENIPGGSDSEEYCLQYLKGLEKQTIYKKRRKSW
jgi:hypothetical protein